MSILFVKDVIDGALKMLPYFNRRAEGFASLNLADDKCFLRCPSEVSMTVKQTQSLLEYGKVQFAKSKSKNECQAVLEKNWGKIMDEIVGIMGARGVAKFEGEKDDAKVASGIVFVKKVQTSEMFAYKSFTLKGWCIIEFPDLMLINTPEIFDHVKEELSKQTLDRLLASIGSKAVSRGAQNWTTILTLWNVCSKNWLDIIKQAGYDPDWLKVAEPCLEDARDASDASDDTSSKASPCSSECIEITDLVCRLADEEGDMSITVQVKECKNGSVLTTLHLANGDVSVQSLKELICMNIEEKPDAKTTLQPDCFTLICNNMQMSEEKPVSEYDIYEGQILTVHLLLTLKGGAKGADKVKMQKNMKLTHATNLKKAVMVSSEFVRPSAVEKNDCLKKLEVEICKVMGMADASAVSSLEYLVKKSTDVSMLQKAMDALDKKKAGTNSIDTRVRNMSKFIMGQEMTDALTLQQSASSAVEACQTCVQMAFTKTCAEIDGFDIGDVKKMLELQIAYVSGQQSRSSGAVADENSVADAMQSMRID
eukprot:Skav235200  [mRNA]  locus=scaffold5443:1144:2757:+ [translate_table: standard]